MVGYLIAALGLVVLVVGSLAMGLHYSGGGGGGLPGWARWDDSCPAWSPDGSRIAFASTRAYVQSHPDYASGYDYDLYVMNADGSQARRLTRFPHNSVDDAAPVWSSNGGLIFFTVTRTGVSIRDSAGSRRTRRGKPFAVNSQGVPRVRPAKPRSNAGPVRLPDAGTYIQYQCPTRSPATQQIAFYRPVDDDLGAGGGSGRVGIICVGDPQHRQEALTQRLGGSCPDTRP
jgi:hypothetical protein